MSSNGCIRQPQPNCQVTAGSDGCEGRRRLLDGRDGLGPQKNHRPWIEREKFDVLPPTVTRIEIVPVAKDDVPD